MNFQGALNGLIVFCIALGAAGVIALYGLYKLGGWVFSHLAWN